MYTQVNHDADYDVMQTLHINTSSLLCANGKNKICKSEIPPQAFEYNKLDPGDVPLNLQNLWVIEKRLISLVQLFVTLIMLPGGQLAQKGTAIHFPIDLRSQTHTLTSQIINTSNIVTVSCDRPNTVPVEIFARPRRILHSLKWLMENNILYKSVHFLFLYKYIHRLCLCIYIEK